VWVFLGILAVTAGLLRAEESLPGNFHISGGLETGVRITADDDHSVPLIFLYSDTTSDYFTLDEPSLGNPTGVRAYLDADYDAGNWGLTFEIQGDNAAYSGHPKYPYGFSLPFAYLWAEFFSGRFLVAAGEFKTSLDNAPTITAIRFGVNPLDHLSLFVDFPFANITDPGNGIEAYELPHMFKETLVGVEYKNDAFGSLSVYTKLYDARAFTYFDPYVDEVALETDKALFVDFRFDLYCTAIPRSEFSVSGQLKYLGLEYGSEGNFMENFMYDIFPSLRAGVILQQLVFFNDEGYAMAHEGGKTFVNTHETLPPLLVFGLTAAYKPLPRLSVGLDLTDIYWKDTIKFIIGIKPKLSFRVGSGAILNAYYKLETGRDWEDESGTKHAVQLDFIWSF
jgi:hypothetical protein